MARPPQHRADAPITFVYSKDPAWNSDLVADEMGPLKGDDLAAHIIGKYHRGETRGDIEAKDEEGRCVLDYLDESWEGIELSRLSLLDVARYRDQGGHTGRLGAARVAYSGDLDKLADLKGAAFVFELGEFAIRCSVAPRPGEPKRSDS